jgi:hypothetical protein
MMQGAEPAEVFFGGQHVLDPGSVADPDQVAGKRGALFVEGLAVEAHFAGRRLHQPANRRSKLVLPLPLGPLICTISPLASHQFEVLEQQAQVAFTGERYGFKKGLVKRSRAFTVQVGGAVAVKRGAQ